ncbi:hypothetical protein D3C79_1115710 [compost metagenome]
MVGHHRTQVGDVEPFIPQLVDLVKDHVRQRLSAFRATLTHDLDSTFNVVFD